MNLSKMSLTDLRSVQDQVKQEIKRREQADLAKAREQIMAIAHSVGIPLKDLLAAHSYSTSIGKKVAVRYRSLDNPALAWTGRGRQPRWIKEWADSGRSLDDLLVK